MHKIANYIQAITSIIAGILLFVLAGNVLLQILSREIIKLPWSWTDEIARFSFIWCALLSASILVRKRRHFVVSILADSIKNKKIRQGLNLLTHFSILFVSGCLLIYGIRYAIMGQAKVSPVISMTMEWVYLAIPVSAFLMIFYTIELMLTDIGILKPISTEEMDLISLSQLLKKERNGGRY